MVHLQKPTWSCFLFFLLLSRMLPFILKVGDGSPSLRFSAFLHCFGNIRCPVSARIGRDDITRRICHNVKHSEAARAHDFLTPRWETPPRSLSHPLNTVCPAALFHVRMRFRWLRSILLLFETVSSSRFPYIWSRDCVWLSFYFKSRIPFCRLSSLFEKLSGCNVVCRRLLRNGSAGSAEQMLQWGDDKSLRQQHPYTK